MRAMLTRDDDYYVPLAARVQKARARRGRSLRLDPRRRVPRAARAARRCSRCPSSGATSAAAKWLAQKENAADLIGGVNLDARDPMLARTLLDLSQTAQISDSLKVGRHVLDSIGTINALHKRVGRAGGLRGAEGARHSVDPGRDGVHLESRRGAEAARAIATRRSSPSRCATASGATSRRTRRSRARPARDGAPAREAPIGPTRSFR